MCPIAVSPCGCDQPQQPCVVCPGANSGVLFPFPWNDTMLWTQWTTAVRDLAPHQPPMWRPDFGSRVCSLHFKPEYLVTKCTGEVVLLRGAILTLPAVPQCPGVLSPDSRGHSALLRASRKRRATDECHSPSPKKIMVRESILEDGIKEHKIVQDAEDYRCQTLSTQVSVKPKAAVVVEPRHADIAPGQARTPSGPAVELSGGPEAQPKVALSVEGYELVCLLRRMQERFQCAVRLFSAKRYSDSLKIAQEILRVLSAAGLRRTRFANIIADILITGCRHALTVNDIKN